MFRAVDTKVNFPEMERTLLEHWYQDGIVEKYLHRNDNSDKRFSFIDGPITANNPMGVHHAWGRTYKDLWQRFWNMRGYAGRFQNGFDCQGLWVEVEVEKELGIKNKQDIENLVPGDKNASIAKFVELCKERVRKFSGIQTDQTKRLGNFMNWDHSYFTMSDENNYMIWHFLKVCFEKGWLYKGFDTVAWCPRCQTAISQHEMLTEDYKELTHETLFVRLPITTAGWEDTDLLIWTTTPWTVPANVAVGVNVKFTYGVWKEAKTGRKIIILSKNELGEEAVRVHKEKAMPVASYVFGHEAIQNGEFVLEKEISGKELIGLSYHALFDALPIVAAAKQENPEKFHTVVDGTKIVTATDGTGLLHVAPGCGKEDFDLGKEEKLPVIAPIDDEAIYVDGMNEFSHQNAKKHPELIIEYLKEYEMGKFLLKTMQFTHRYPACWRCKTELVWKVTEEWYIGMDIVENGGTETFRQQMMESAKKIEWHPDFALDRELDWLTNMHDWLISKKNRYWGLALPIYTCESCGTFTVIGGKDELQEKAVAGWEQFDGHSPHKPYIDGVKIACACGGVMTRTNDVGNPWLDAGIVPFSTLVDPKTGKLSYTTDKEYWAKWFPASFITESFPGQFKNWFYALIAMSTALEKTNPFKKILGYASMLAEDGRPMHKSWGNSIEFNEAADTIGADVMRWMFAKADTEQNLLFGYKKADETRRQFHLMLWNIYNFFVLNAVSDNWSPVRGDSIALLQNDKANVLDQWIVARLNETVQVVTESLEQASAQQAALSIEKFVTDLSLWYVRRSRDRIGPNVENSDDKDACYQTLYTVLVTLCKVMAPFMPYLSDEMYTNLTGEESVHLADWPSFAEASDRQVSLIEQMKMVRQVVELGLSLRKEKQMKVRQPLASFTVKNVIEIGDEGLRQLIKDELNVKAIEFINDLNINVSEDVHVSDDKVVCELDTNLTPELIAEGQARELIRQIQDERKNLGTTVIEKVKVTLPSWPQAYESYITKSANVASLTQGETFTVERLSQ